MMEFILNCLAFGYGSFTLAVVIWGWIDSMDDNVRVSLPSRTAEEIFPGLAKALEPGSDPEFQHLLKRLAASRP